MFSDLILEKGQKAPYYGVLVREDSYRDDQNQLEHFRKLQDQDMIGIEPPKPPGNGLIWFLTGFGAGVIAISLIHQK